MNEPQIEHRGAELIRRIEKIRELKKSSGDFDDIQDKEIFATPRTQRNSITELPRQEDGRAVLVPTGAGVVVEKGQDIATDHLYACSGLLIFGGQKDLLAHLTPSSNLPYQNYEYPDGTVSSDRKDTAEKIISAFETNGSSLRDASVVLLGNARNTGKNSKFYYKDVELAWNDLERIFLEAGAKSVRKIELPLDNSLVYYTHESPGEIHVFGYPVHYSEKGELIVDKNSTEHIVIPLDPEQPLPFVLGRPEEK